MHRPVALQHKLRHHHTRATHLFTWGDAMGLARYHRLAIAIAAQAFKRQALFFDIPLYDCHAHSHSVAHAHGPEELQGLLKIDRPWAGQLRAQYV